MTAFGVPEVELGAHTFLITIHKIRPIPLKESKMTHKNKQSSLSLGGGGVLNKGIVTTWAAKANCWRHDGASLVAFIVLRLRKGTGGSQRRLPVGDCA